VLSEIGHAPLCEAALASPRVAGLQLCTCCSFLVLNALPQEDEELPADWTTLFDDVLFKFDTSLVPEAAAMYERLSVKKSPLSLIAPQFETPLPPLQPAVFPPAIREPPPPVRYLSRLSSVRTLAYDMQHASLVKAMHRTT
jgi:hypothetical protein